MAWISLIMNGLLRNDEAEPMGRGSFGELSTRGSVAEQAEPNKIKTRLDVYSEIGRVLFFRVKNGGRRIGDQMPLDTVSGKECFIDHIPESSLVKSWISLATHSIGK